MTGEYEVLTMGRVGVDIYPLQADDAFVSPVPGLPTPVEVEALLAEAGDG